ncbi:ATP/GTP-binding protein [Methylomonas sp. ZR1]|uniref:AAA family ATPase n=1 Tax=Methylomonas sp. ZR1 TaxID=1797072 RepID=UPI0014920F40|nr:ATP-binding protein [Methylomonas sp. ZR1]NOV31239.1 ATP-binding protein [Methylomonas sp. ZR1]
MLIEFSVSNFRSFREKQTFSMVAAPRLRKRENLIKPVVKGEKLPDLLKVAAIYGPNASGKSNLIKALDLVRDVSSRQPTAHPMPLPVVPFRFDPALIDKPTKIDLHFICFERRYQFELALTQQRIVEERLIMFPEGKETLLYERKHEAGGDIYRFGAALEGGTDLHELWRKATGPQTLFISQAVANSSEELKQLRMPFLWFQGGLAVFFTHSSTALAQITQQRAETDSEFATALSSFLREVDVPITAIRFDGFESDVANFPRTLLNPPQDGNQTKTILTHRTALGDAEFDFEEESDGTKNLIGFWTPWQFLTRFSKQGLALIVDELDTSLHPEIVASLVTRHLHAESPGQLIFTTHDTHVMDAKLLRRDQFWLTERDANGATQLRSIHDFEGREGEDLEKRYYEGRYRALPIIRRS